jgi:benzoyl-CoA reductase/2-hydroxyglutaryl-CoA dehydratase subunit BcrC/BadD/HgdB
LETTAEKLTSKQLLRQIDKAYDQRLRNAHADGKLVAWCSALVPQEFLSTMDIICAFPENHAAGLAARGQADPFVKYTEALGYKPDICSYARVNIAVARMENNDAPDATEEMKEVFAKMAALPKPDMIITTNNSCTVIPKWYGEMANYFGVPYVLIETPYVNGTEPTQDAIDYMKDQFRSLISKLEEICKKPFDFDKFEDVMKRSTRNAKQWTKVLNYANEKPSPIDGFNFFNYMSSMVRERSGDNTYELFKLLEEEMEEFIKTGQSQYKGEQNYRIQWEGIPCWPYLKHNVTFMKEYGIALVASLYPGAWGLNYEPGDWDSLATAYLKIFTNCDFEYNVKVRKEIAEAANIDGIICHSNKSCRVNILLQQAVLRDVSNQVGVPLIFFDGDQCDPNLFAKAQFETRLQSLVESMEANKAQKEMVTK